MSLNVGLLKSVELLDDVVFSTEGSDGLKKRKSREYQQGIEWMSIVELREGTHSDGVYRLGSIARRSSHGLLALSLIAPKIDDLQKSDRDQDEERRESNEGNVPAEDESNEHRTGETGDRRGKESGRRVGTDVWRERNRRSLDDCHHQST